MKIVVCGGGISGLSAAYYASKALSQASAKQCKIIVLEKGEQVGGWMKTNVTSADRKEYGGAISELGPRSIRTAGVVGNNTLQLISDLGLYDEVLPVSSSHLVAKKRLIYVKSSLHTLPNGLLSLCTKQSPFSASLARMIGPGLLKNIPSTYEAMHEISNARFGTEVADYLVDAFTRGVFAADCRELSMKAAFPPMWKRLAPKNASMPRKPAIPNAQLFNKTLLANPFVKQAKDQKWTQWGMKKGFSFLNQSLAKRLTVDGDVEIIRGAEAQRLVQQSDDKLTIELATSDKDGRSASSIENVDHLISALPSYELSKILGRTPCTSAKTAQDNSYPYVVLGQMLGHIRFVDVAIAVLEYSGTPQDNLPNLGFGHLVPSIEPSNVLGIVYDSCAFPEHDRLETPTTRMTCMMGGSWFRQLFGEPSQVRSEMLEQAALESVAEQLGISKDPLTANVHVHRKCIPTYKVGHTDLVEQAEDFIAQHKMPISLVGASYWGVSVNDCIFNSRIAVSQLLEARGITSEHSTQ